MKEYYYKQCTLCPRNCRTDRTVNAGYCGCRSYIRAARAGLHFYEEPYISGSRGSGTVFFSGCSMKCVFCQNIELSRDAKGFDISVNRLSDIFLELQQKGAENINLVTGTHFTPSIAEALRMAKDKGLYIPVIWNSSCYEKPETLKLLEGLVDIWLPDLKTLDKEESRLYYHAEDYPDAAKAALEYMVFASRLEFKDDMLVSGVNVRHLVMPRRIRDTFNVLDYLYGRFGDDICISLMNQYTPMGEMPYKELERKVSKREYEKAVSHAIDIGITKCMIQEGGTVSESFIPDFDGEGIIDKSEYRKKASL